MIFFPERLNTDLTADFTDKSANTPPCDDETVARMGHPDVCLGVRTADSSASLRNDSQRGNSKGNEYGSVAIVCPTHRDKACDEWGTRHPGRENGSRWTREYPTLRR